MQVAAQDVMKRKAMEIEKSKIESARTGKAGTSAYAPSNMSSITINNNRSNTDLDLTPTFSRCLLLLHLLQRFLHNERSALPAATDWLACDLEDALGQRSPCLGANHKGRTMVYSLQLAM